MARRQTSTPPSFNRSPLVHLLTSLPVPAVVESADTFAERLSRWVAWKDAIGLSGALDAPPAASDPATGPPDQDFPAYVTRRVGQVVDVLTQAIATDPLLAEGAVPTGTVHAMTTRKPLAPLAPEPLAFSRYRHCYRTHQRSMEESIGSLRSQVRSMVAGVSPTLGRLAALDAAMDHALQAHQRRVFGQVPVMLEQHFQRDWALPGLGAIQTSPAVEGAWHDASAALGPTMRRALLAELEVRLQPVAGLVDALAASGAARP